MSDAETSSSGSSSSSSGSSSSSSSISSSSSSSSSGSDKGAAAAAAAAAVAKHVRLQALAVARTRDAAVAVVNSRRARQRNNMRPLLLEEHAQVRVSFLYSPKVRRLLKNHHGSEYLPKWTAEVYTVIGRSLAPGSRRVVLYHVKVEGSGSGSGSGEQLAEGEQVPCQVGRVGSRPVQLHLDLMGLDRRWLQPVPRSSIATTGEGGGVGAAVVTANIAKRYPGQRVGL